VIDHPVDRLEAWLHNPHWAKELPRPEDVRAVLNMLHEANMTLDKLRLLVSRYESAGRR